MPISACAFNFNLPFKFQTKNIQHAPISRSLNDVPATLKWRQNIQISLYAPAIEHVSAVT